MLAEPVATVVDHPCINHADPKTLEIYARETAPLVGNAVTQLGL
jgi:hypothetical protein